MDNPIDHNEEQNNLSINEHVKHITSHDVHEIAHNLEGKIPLGIAVAAGPPFAGAHNPWAKPSNITDYDLKENLASSNKLKPSLVCKELKWNQKVGKDLLEKTAFQREMVKRDIRKHENAKQKKLKEPLSVPAELQSKLSQQALKITNSIHQELSYAKKIENKESLVKSMINKLSPK
ncbi:unnamed protein product [Gordionus sp. m RMFG-2023]